MFQVVTHLAEIMIKFKEIMLLFDNAYKLTSINNLTVFHLGSFGKFNSMF